MHGIEFTEYDSPKIENFGNSYNCLLKNKRQEFKQVPNVWDPVGNICLRTECN